MFKKMTYQDKASTIICAERIDGTFKIIEPNQFDLWNAAISGLFGPIDAYVPQEDLELEEQIMEARKLVDRKTGEFRRQFITDISGQAMVYLHKQKTAEQFLADEDPDLDQYPRIMAAVGVIADTPRGVAEVWVARAAEWEQIDILIESRRETFKKRLGEASSEEEVETIMNEFKNWSM